MPLPLGKDEWQVPYPSGTEKWKSPPYPGGEPSRIHLILPLQNGSLTLQTALWADRQKDWNFSFQDKENMSNQNDVRRWYMVRN